MKRLLTLLLCVMMVVCFMPSMAWATDEQVDTGTQCTLDAESCNHVAELGELHYNTLQGAIDGVTKRNCTIRLIGDTTENVELNYTEKYNLTLDLNGHKVDGNITNILSVLEIRDNSETKSGWIEGDITNTDAQYSSKAAITRIYGGHIGGTLTKGNNTKLWAYTAFYNEDPSPFIDQGYLVNPVNDDHGCKYQVVEDQAAKIIRDGQETIYRTLSNAIREIKDGDTVVLLKDFTGNSSFSIGKSVTIDLNNHTVTGTQAPKVFEVNIYKSDINVTIKDGSIIHSPSGQVTYGAVYAKQGGNLTLENVTITSNPDSAGNGYGVRIGDGTSVKNPEVVIRGTDTTISAPTAGIAVIGAESTSETATLTVEAGTITGGYYGIAGNGGEDNTSITVSGGNVNGDTMAIYHPQDGNLTITGGSLTGAQGVQYIGAGTLEISGGSITATAAALTSDPEIQSGDGSVVDGAAVSIISRGGEYGAADAATVSITGGTITSEHNVAIREYGVNESSLINSMSLTQAEDATLVVTGGDENRTAVKLDILSGDKAKMVSGGIYSNDVSGLCTEGYNTVQITSGEYNGYYGVHIGGAHIINTDLWVYDEDGHWHACECGQMEEGAPTAHTFIWVVDKNATSTEKGSKHEECSVCGYQKAAVEIPATGSYIPPAPPADNVTNSGATGTDTATTTADINTTASNGTANAVVDQDTAEKIVKKATDNKSAEVVVDAKTSAGTADNTTVTLPTDTVKKIVEQTDAEVTVETDAAEVTLDQKAVEAVATKATGSDVQIVVEKTKDETKEMEFELKVVSNGVEIGEFDGGNVKVTVKLNASLAALKDAALTCVHIADDGTYTKVGGAKNNDGTYTFTTTHFSSYMIMAEEEADKVIDEQTLEAVKNTKLVAHSEMSKAKGKKAVKVYWNAKDGSELNFDGYEVYRSLKRYEGFGTKPFFETTKTKYYNTSIKKGTRYYYKVRGYKMINGEKAYTEYSTKAWRTVK